LPSAVVPSFPVTLILLSELTVVEPNADVATFPVTEILAPAVIDYAYLIVTGKQ